MDCERGAGDLRESVTQVFWKDGTLLAEHDWLHDDPIYANCFLRDAAERGEWVPVKLRAKADEQAGDTSVSAAAAGEEVVFAGVDVQRDRIAMSIASQQAEPGTRIEITLTDAGGWKVVASHPFGRAFMAYFSTAAEVQKHIGAWLAELRTEAALGRSETVEEERVRQAGMAADEKGA